MKFYISIFLLLVSSLSLEAQRRKAEIIIRDGVVSRELNYWQDTIVRFEIAQSAEFRRPLLFCNAVFNTHIELRWASVDSINLRDATFIEDVNFFKTEFNAANFFFATFSKDVNFEYTGFHKLANFQYTSFQQKAFFSYTYFLHGASFYGATFRKGLPLVGAKFWKVVDFGNVTINKGISFAGAVFFYPESSLFFRNLILSDSVSFYFQDAVLPGLIVFSDIPNLKQTIDLTVADFSDSSHYDKKGKRQIPVGLYFYHVDISKFNVDYVHFRLYLPDSTIETTRHFISFDQKCSVYEALLNNFKTRGEARSYEVLDIEYQEFKLYHSWARWISWFPKLWWNFGYDKEYIFIWTASLLFIFTCFTYFFIYSLNVKVYPIENIPTIKSWSEKGSLHDFRNRFWSSFTYTWAIFFKLNLKLEKIQFKEKRGSFYLITVYTIGLICLAYMANFVIQKTI